MYLHLLDKDSLASGILKERQRTGVAPPVRNPEGVNKTAPPPLRLRKPMPLPVIIMRAHRPGQKMNWHILTLSRACDQPDIPL